MGVRIVKSVSRHSDPPPRRRDESGKKSLSEVAGEIWQGVLDVVEDLVNPPPRMVPVPVRKRRG